MSKVIKIKYNSDLKQTVKQSVDHLGGFEKFIKPGDVVLLKPNFNTADPYPASSDLEFIKAVTELAYEQRPKLVIIGESCTMTMNTRKVMEKLGVFELQNLKPCPRVIIFEERDWIKKDIPGAKYLKTVKLPEILDRVDKLILLPCLKTHFQAQYTGALKLSVGFMKPSQRVKLHLKNIQEKIAELNLVIKPNLIIMDARKCFINQGPMYGDVRGPNLIMASTSRVNMDIEGVKIIQSYEGNSLKNIKPEDLGQIKYSLGQGLH